MIIIEGPDGAGKSTLMERLRADLPFIPLAPRFATSKGGPLTNLGGLVYEDIKRQMRMSEPQLYDRHPIISEYVYGHTLPGREVNPYFKFPSAKTLRQQIAESALVVWCMPPFIAVEANVTHGHNDQMPGVADSIDKLYEAYLMQRIFWPGECLTYDYTLSNMGKVGHYAEIIQSINRHIASWPERSTLNV